MAGKQGANVVLLSKIVALRLANAEWLLCGTGPVVPGQPELPIDLPPPSTPTFPLYDTQATGYVQTTISRPTALEPQRVTDKALEIARHVYVARTHDKPVLLYVDAVALVNNVGPAVVEMMKRRYITGVALCSNAAERDLERGLFGGFATKSMRLAAYNTMLNAATMAAANGLGWGEAIGRWCFPAGSDRAASILASGYELGVPVTVHLALGDCASHLFPAYAGAVRGAELGAASYVDLLVFAEQVRKLPGEHPGAFLYASGGDNFGLKLFFSALAAAANDDVEPTGQYPHFIGAEYRHTFPALLAACDAVYDGSADDGR